MVNNMELLLKSVKESQEKLHELILFIDGIAADIFLTDHYPGSVNNLEKQKRKEEENYLRAIIDCAAYKQFCLEQRNLMLKLLEEELSKVPVKDSKVIEDPEMLRKMLSLPAAITSDDLKWKKDADQQVKLFDQSYDQIRPLWINQLNAIQTQLLLLKNRTQQYSDIAANIYMQNRLNVQSKQIHFNFDPENRYGLPAKIQEFEFDQRDMLIKAAERMQAKVDAGKISYADEDKINLKKSENTEVENILREKAKEHIDDNFPTLENHKKEECQEIIVNHAMKELSDTLQGVQQLDDTSLMHPRLGLDKMEACKTTLLNAEKVMTKKIESIDHKKAQIHSDLISNKDKFELAVEAKKEVDTIKEMITANDSLLDLISAEINKPIVQENLNKGNDNVEDNQIRPKGP